MLRHLTSRQVAEMEAYTRIENDPEGEEGRQKILDTRLRDRLMQMGAQHK